MALLEKIVYRCLAFLLLAFTLLGADIQYSIEVQVVDLQVTVLDSRGQYINNLAIDDFVITEDGIFQTPLDLQLNRQPYSIGIMIDTSESMQSMFLKTKKATEDFIAALQPEDEFFLMTFDEKLVMKKEFGKPGDAKAGLLEDLRFGEGTRLFDALQYGIDQLGKAHHPRRALFVISDGVNTRGHTDLSSAIRKAIQNKILIYSLAIQKADSDLDTLRTLSEETGGTYFVLYREFPRLQAAYEKITGDLAHRFTLYYRSNSDYKKNKPRIRIQMKNPEWKVRYQKLFIPISKEEQDVGRNN